MAFENLRQELDDITAIADPGERLMGVLRFMALCSGLQGAAMINVAHDAGGDSEALVGEMDALANACMPLAAAALAEVVARKA
jgi:hypothetical protein